MALAPGTRLGAYEIVGLLGAGGMGEVYRALDARLNRQVAIKVLPEAFTHDPDRLARFKREAQVLASLNHPNIGGIYGFEDSNSTQALVLELVDGPTLADRIVQGPLPLDEALPIVKQIAEALEAAHEQGIIHRDLKPANIKVRPDGTVKVLDFGLAKALASEGVSSSAVLSNSPTITSPIGVTGVGTLLGTAAYMSPEQVRGKTVDRRSDVWAFGCVLYEMLTARRVFEGEDVSDMLATVLRGQPDWHSLPQNTPPSIQRVLRRSLEKDRKVRLADMADARLEIEEALGGSGPTYSPRPSKTPRRRLLLEVVGGVAIALTAVFATRLVVDRPQMPAVRRFALTLPAANRLNTGPGGVNAVVSPIGDLLVYTAAGPSLRLAVRRINDVVSTELQGTERASNPFFSPDGTQVGFTADGGLQRISVVGGPVSRICCALGGFFGATWAPDDTIVFGSAEDQQINGLFRVPASGGEPQRLTSAEPGGSHRSPQMLPGGTAVLFTAVPPSGRLNEARLSIHDLANGQSTTLLEGAVAGQFVRSGHILYARPDGVLLAATFDPDSRSITGQAVPVLKDIFVKGGGTVNASVSDDGTLLYVPGSGAQDRRLVWLDREGRPLGTVGDAAVPFARYPRISPEGRRLVATIGPPSAGEIWIFDLAAAAQPRKLTFRNHNVLPQWTPDGRQIVFESDRDGPRALYVLPADGSRQDPDRLGAGNIESVVPDGKRLVFSRQDPKTRRDLWILQLGGERKVEPYLQTPASEGEARVSPDGRWIAYVSDETGRAEVWVRPLDRMDGPVRVSASGAHTPVWSRDSKELFFVTDGPKLLVASVLPSQEEFRFGAPRLLFQRDFVGWFPNEGGTFDVAPDGRILTVQQDEQSEPLLPIVVLNWFEELKRLTPAN